MVVRRRDPPKVTHQRVFWVPESKEVVLPIEGEAPGLPGVLFGRVPYRVWTLYDIDNTQGRFGSADQPPALPINPVHNHGAFLEDYVHDWNVDTKKGNHVLRYYSRVADHSVWILCEYVDQASGRK